MEVDSQGTAVETVPRLRRTAHQQLHTSFTNAVDVGLNLPFLRSRSNAKSTECSAWHPSVDIPGTW